VDMDPRLEDRREPSPETETEPLLQFFSYKHLPPSLADASQPFHDLAHHLEETMRRNSERTACLRKLLEAKDCAVRSLLQK